MSVANSPRVIEIITIVGARPQFVKAAALSSAIQIENQSKSGALINEKIIHTGQHFDDNMSKVFFEELGIPKPLHNLGISGLQHGEMTGKMIAGISEVLEKHSPDLVLTYGDTNSTLAGSLAASRLRIPSAHVEAGLRSFNEYMPEEINRKIADRVSSILLSPSLLAQENLVSEGLGAKAHFVGDVMFDTALRFAKKAKASNFLKSFNLTKKDYILVTLHRAENCENVSNLTNILNALKQISRSTKVVLPVHPRVRHKVEAFFETEKCKSVILISPLSYIDFTNALLNSSGVLTDSGGVQKEAFFNKIPCITMRNQTEWLETVNCGANVLVGADESLIIDAWNNLKTISFCNNPYGDGCAGKRIVKVLQEYFS